MRYILLNVVFLSIAVAALAVALTVRPDRRHLIVRWRVPMGCAAVILLVLTVVFDNIMIAVGLMTYPEAAISGLRIGAAPLEDFAYPIAALILLPAVWLLTTRRSERD